jgi:DNA-binding response OmpR family regulator
LLQVNNRKRILIVDDEPGIGKVLSIHFKNSGLDVTATTSGAEAVELIRNQEPDIVLLDVLMPDVNGMIVLDRVRAFSQVPIIMFTGRPEIAQAARENGANDCVGKPFDPDLLLGKIMAVLAASRDARGISAD